MYLRILLSAELVFGFIIWLFRYLHTHLEELHLLTT